MAERIAAAPLKEPVRPDDDSAARQRLLALLPVQPQGLPKYLQLRHAIAETIRGGYWKAGAKLPTELEFSKLAGISQGTVQRALADLASAGQIVRQHGNGTFVAEPKRRLGNILICRFLNDDETADLPVFSKVIGRSRNLRQGRFQRHFGVNEPVFRIDRCLNIGNEFNLLSRCYLSEERFGDIANASAAELEGVSLKALIADQLSSSVTEEVQCLQMETFAPAVCKAIGVDAGTVGGLVESLGRALPVGTVYFHEIYVPPSRRRMVIGGLEPMK